MLGKIHMSYCRLLTQEQIPLDSTQLDTARK